MWFKVLLRITCYSVPKYIIHICIFIWIINFCIFYNILLNILWNLSMTKQSWKGQKSAICEEELIKALAQRSLTGAISFYETLSFCWQGQLDIDRLGILFSYLKAIYLKKQIRVNIQALSFILLPYSSTLSCLLCCRFPNKIWNMAKVFDASV